MVDHADNPRRRLRLSLTALGILVVLGTIGFYAIGIMSDRDRGIFESLYLTAVVLSTVGAWHQAMELNLAEELWVVLLILFGIGTAAFTIGNIMALVFGGEVNRLLGRRQLTGKLKSMEDHYII